MRKKSQISTRFFLAKNDKIISNLAFLFLSVFVRLNHIMQFNDVDTIRQYVVRFFFCGGPVQNGRFAFAKDKSFTIYEREIGQS